MALETVKTLFDGLQFTHRPEGCTEDQIKAVEKQMGITFPPSYHEFLLWMGTRRSGILLGSEWMIEDLPGLKAKCAKLIADHKFPEKLPDDAFVFWGSQGQVYNFLRLSQGDASPVYRYHATLETKTFTPINKSFAEWLAEQIQQHVERLKGFGKKW